mmetsp:Transcript_27832/g.54738  ORF Transcript_27832/g.54738 Transcript_27832/m.54738 type:complete len:243 (-) Transcript_27832:434-1162(-)
MDAMCLTQSQAPVATQRCGLLDDLPVWKDMHMHAGHRSARINPNFADLLAERVQDRALAQIGDVQVDGQRRTGQPQRHQLCHAQVWLRVPCVEDMVTAGMCRLCPIKESIVKQFLNGHIYRLALFETRHLFTPGIEKNTVQAEVPSIRVEGRGVRHHLRRFDKKQAWVQHVFMRPEMEGIVENKSQLLGTSHKVVPHACAHMGLPRNLLKSCTAIVATARFGHIDFIPKESWNENRLTIDTQ